MQRRGALAGIATAVAVLLGGCSGDDDSAVDSPTARVQELFEALNEGDRQAANDMIAPEAPYGEVSAEDAARFEDLTVDLAETAVLSETDREAEIEATVRFYEGDTPVGAVTQRYVLRNTDDDWLVWDVTDVRER